MFEIVLLQIPGGGAGTMNLIFIGGILWVLYVGRIRPQQKKQKDQKKFIGAIKKGDTVVTLGGLHGKITSMDDNTVTLEVDRGARIKMEKSSLSLEASKQYNND